MATSRTKEVGRNGRQAPERPAGHDFLNVEATSPRESSRCATRPLLRAERIKPNIKDWFDGAVFPKEIVPEFAGLGLLGMHLEGYGCAGRSAVEYGLACMELEAGDSGLRTFVSVQGSLAMSAIHKFGSEEQKQEWLPRMARARP
jgi:glutaryl-CoA dehydrogenase